jgi:hypothetical protein
MSQTKSVSVTDLGGYTRLVVPNGYAPEVSIALYGASGGGGGNYYGASGAGGAGSAIYGQIIAKPGDVLDIYIGEGGESGTSAVYGGGGGAGGRSARIGTPSGSRQWYPVSLPYAWSNWMNAYAVWTNPDQQSPQFEWVTSTRSVYFPAGLYRFYAEADNLMNVYFDGSLLYSTPSDNTFQIYQDGVTPTGYLQISEGFHTMQFDVYNEGGPAGFAFQWQNEAIANSVHWSTRTDLNANQYSQWYHGGNGGNTGGDGGYVYSGPGGGGGASVVYLNGTLALVAGGGGGGGAEGGHGAGATVGRSGGGGSPYGGEGEPGSDGYDIAGTPGGGGGYNGGSQGSFIYYDDAPSAGANGGTDYIGIGSYWTQTNTGLGYLGNGANGSCTLIFTQLGSGKVKVAGSWKQITGNWVKVAGQWKQITNAWTKVDGVWKLVSGGIPISTTFYSGNYG